MLGLKGLGLELPIAGDQAVKRLCAEVNLDPCLAELGHLILFNLEFLTKRTRRTLFNCQSYSWVIIDYPS